MWEDLQADRMPGVDLRLLDMGYVYDSDIILRGSATPATAWWQPQAGDGHSAYVPTADPGARAPHAWTTANGRRMSTIDHFGRGFVAVTDGRGAGWLEAAELVATHSGIPLATVMLHEPEAVAAYGLLPGEVVLVRPDGHVTWRSGPSLDDATPDQITRRLEEVFATAVGRPPPHRS
jgi:putative polyketide hydroxylase